MVGGLFAFSTLAAQDVDVRGVVVDPEGDPVPGLAVALHRVGDEGGAQVALGETDAEGRFAIPVALPADSAIYFATTRYNGRLHVGTPFRGPIADAGEQLISLNAAENPPVGAPGAGATPPQQEPRAGLGEWLPWILLPLLTFALLVIHWRRSRQAPAVRRALLAQLAELEESHASSPEPMEGEPLARYQRERAGLRARISAL